MRVRLCWALILGLAGLLLATAPTRAADLCDVKTERGREAMAPSPPTLPGASAHIYKTVGDLPLRTYVFQPKGKAKAQDRSAVVFLFGGGWMFGNVSHLTPQARYLADRGAVVILVDYRVYCRNKVSILDEMKDAKAAMRWIRGHAGELGFPPDRIALYGGSSGGHLALSTALFDQIDDPHAKDAPSPRPDLLLLFYPCVDETSPEEAISAQAIQTYGAEVSPTLHVGKGMPPMLVVQGTADSLYAENRVYCAKIVAAGDSCSFVEFQKAPHGFFQDPPDSQAWFQAGLLEMEGFLTAHGYLPPRE